MIKKKRKINHKIQPGKKTPAKKETSKTAEKISGPTSGKTKRNKILREPKTYISVNKKTYRAINPQKALAIAKKLTSGVGKYKVHVIYGKEQISKRKTETIENEGKFNNAREARQAIYAFLDESLWVPCE